MKNNDVSYKRYINKTKPLGDLKCLVAVLSGLVLCLLGVVLTLLTYPKSNEKSIEQTLGKGPRFIFGVHSGHRKYPSHASRRIGTKKVGAASKGAPCLTKQCVETSSYILNKMDLSVQPCDDMYLFACGGLHATTKIPRKARIHLYTETNDRFLLGLREILAYSDTQFNGKNSSAVTKMKAFYKSCMDENSLEEKSSRILSVISDLGSWTLSKVGIVPFNKTGWSIQTTLTKLHKMGFFLFFNLEHRSRRNKANRTMHMATLKEAEPSELMELFLFGPSHHDKIIEKIVRLAQSFGEEHSSAVKKAKEILKFFEIVALKKDKAKEGVFPLDMFQFFMGAKFNVTQYLEEMTGATDIAANTFINLVDMNYFIFLGKAFNSLDSELMANVLMIHFLEEAKNYLPVAHRLGPSTDRETFCMDEIANYFSPTMTALFVRDFLKPETKSKAIAMGENIRKQIVNTFNNVTWFDENLKKALIGKAEALKMDIGYPDWILDPDNLDEIYQNVSVKQGELLTNAIVVRKEFVTQAIQRSQNGSSMGYLFTKRGRSSEYYMASTHQITIHGHALQPPPFSLHYPTSMQYGGTGTTLGHEIMHAFDSSRISRDVYNREEAAWTPEANESYTKGAECLLDMYSSFVNDGVEASGNSTLNEDICDNEGLKLAYMAYKALGPLHDTRLPGLNFTDDQLFFLAFAQKFCIMEINGEQLKGTKHNHMRIRVRGSVANSEDFAKAFACPANSPNNLKKKCTVF